MTEGEPRYLITDSDALIAAIRTDPPEIFQGSTRGLRDLRHLTRANYTNRFTWLNMNKLYAQVGHGTVGALFPSEEGMISHLDYPYAYEMQRGVVVRPILHVRYNYMVLQKKYQLILKLLI